MERNSGIGDGTRQWIVDYYGDRRNGIEGTVRSRLAVLFVKRILGRKRRVDCFRGGGGG